MRAISRRLRSKRATGVLAWACATLSLQAWADAPSGGSFTVGEVAPGVFVHVGRQAALGAPGHEDIATIGFIVGSRCVAVIDTGGSVAIGAALRAAIARSSRAPVCYVINTHVHVDHVLGNAAFLADHPSFVGHAALADAMRASTQFFMTEYAEDFSGPPTPAQVVGPDRLVAHEMTLDLGNRRLTLHAWPRAHTDCDLTIYDERTGTLWTGDLLFRERLPALDGSVTGWLAALGTMSAMQVNWAIPGHGAPTQDLAAAIEPERRYLQALVDGVRGQLAAGKPMQEAMSEVALEQRPHWVLWDGVHERNVARAYQELEWQ